MVLCIQTSKVLWVSEELFRSFGRNKRLNGLTRVRREFHRKRWLAQVACVCDAFHVPWELWIMLFVPPPLDFSLSRIPNEKNISHSSENNRTAGCVSMLKFGLLILNCSCQVCNSYTLSSTSTSVDQHSNIVDATLVRISWSTIHPPERSRMLQYYHLALAGLWCRISQHEQ